MILCDFGCNQPSVHQFKTGRHCCSTSTSRCPAMKLKNGTGVRSHIAQFDNPNDRWSNGHPKGALGKPGVRGKTYEEMHGFEKAVQLKQAQSVRSKNNKNYDKLSDDQKRHHRERCRENINARYAAGWMPKAGRCEKYTHVSPIAGEVTLDGTWELAVAQWLDHKQYNWRRNTTKFPYVDDAGKPRTYTPDFWVEQLDGFLEVKGYETDLDKLKWKSFTERLTVWRLEHINEIRKQLVNR